MANAEGHLVHKGFEAWVVMDDKPLPQFGIEYKEATREATAWIPSEAGKTFSICFRKISGEDNHDFTADVYLDGNLVSEMVYERDHMGYLNVKTISFLEISATETRDFMFNTIELTDDDAFLKVSSAAQVGEIKVVLQTALAQDEQDQEPLAFKTCQDAGKIHERSKKGVVHQVKYSESKTRPPRMLNACYSTPVGEPVTFIFKYRPLETLQAKDIAPRPAPPAQVNNDAVDDDEIVTRERQLLAELEQVRKLKRIRKDEDEEQPAKRVKTEPVVQFLSGEVIDLTVEHEEVDNLTNREVIDLT